MKIAAKTVVTMEYTLKNEQGEVLDTSDGAEPLTYLHGVGGIVPGLEKALDGKTTGDIVDVSLTPAEGYGNRNEKLIRRVPIRKVGDGRTRIAAGGRYPAMLPDGPTMVTVATIDGDYATVDPNHPLADMKLNFHVKVVDVRKATADEIKHGHVHGAHGHDH
jgi:FKBP-type peptidyl-prolyl cis-trans isomerase SlyD